MEIVLTESIEEINVLINDNDEEIIGTVKDGDKGNPGKDGEAGKDGKDYNGGVTTVIVSSSRPLNNTDKGKALICIGTADIVLTVDSTLDDDFSCVAKNATSSKKVEWASGTATIENPDGLLSIINNRHSTVLSSGVSNIFDAIGNLE